MEPNYPSPTQPPVPQSEVRHTPRKSRALLAGFIGVLLLGLGLVGGFLYANKNTPPVIQNTSNVSPTSSTQLKQVNLDDLQNFPLYPGAMFMKTQANDPCPTGMIGGGLLICDTHNNW